MIIIDETRTERGDANSNDALLSAARTTGTQAVTEAPFSPLVSRVHPTPTASS